MNLFADPARLLIIGTALAGVLAALHAMATYMRNQVYLHDVQVRVHQLRNEYSEKLKKLEDSIGEVDDVAVVDEASSDRAPGS